MIIAVVTCVLASAENICNEPIDTSTSRNKEELTDRLNWCANYSNYQSCGALNDAFYGAPTFKMIKHMAEINTRRQSIGKIYGCAPQIFVYFTGTELRQMSKEAIDHIDESLPSPKPIRNAIELYAAAREYEIDSESAIATYGPMNTWNVGEVTSFYNLFQRWKGGDIDVTNWNTSSVHSMTNTLRQDSQSNYGQDFNVMGLDTWDVRNVIILADFFAFNKRGNPDLASWQLDSVITAHDAFNTAESFTGEGIELWATNIKRAVAHDCYPPAELFGDGYKSTIASWHLCIKTACEHESCSNVMPTTAPNPYYGGYEDDDESDLLNLDIDRMLSHTGIQGCQARKIYNAWTTSNPKMEGAFEAVDKTCNTTSTTTTSLPPTSSSTIDTVLIGLVSAGSLVFVFAVAGIVYVCKQRSSVEYLL